MKIQMSLMGSAKSRTLSLKYREKQNGKIT